MKNFPLLFAASLVFGASLATAQPGPRAGMPCTAASGTSATGPGCPGPMGGQGALWGQRHTMGWSMMTPQERDAHRKELAGIKSYDECKAYMAKHHDEMVERAKAQGRPMPAAPRRDACAPLKTAK